MITSLTIKNMRCFKDFSLDNIGQITLISGENNVGKSTLLESLYLLFTYNRPDLFIMLNVMRGMPLTFFSPDLLWEPLFHGLNTQEPLTVSCVDDNGEKSISFCKDEQFSISSVPSLPIQGLPMQSLPMQANISPITSGYSLKMEYRDKDKTNIGHWVPQGNTLGFQWNFPPNSPQPYAHYVGPRIVESNNAVSQLFGQVELLGKKDILIESIRLLDGMVSDIATIMSNNNAYLYAKKNGDQGFLHLPIAAMGDGINRLLIILCIMIAKPGCLLLVDEIENGFHYSFYQKLWEVIESVAIMTKSQIFVTSHSYECIQNAAKVLNKKNAEKTLLRYIRLGKSSEGLIKPHIFSSESLELAIDSEMEIR